MPPTSGGTVTAPGNATVLLPSREHGAVVLPDVPPEIRAKAATFMARHNKLVAERGSRGSD